MALSLGYSAAIVVALAAVPFAWGSFTAFQLGLYLIYGIAAQGVALCWGRAGFLPLGQALFFGIGAYIVGAALKTGAGWAAFAPAIIAACVLPALLAGLVGLLVFNRQIGSGPYFSLITLALAMLGFQLANALDWLTGGFNGMTGIPGLPGIDPFGSYYFVIVAALVISTAVLALVASSPFGQLLSAVRDNEERLQFFGFATHRLKAASFAIAGAVAGLAGALYAPHQGIVTPQTVGFLLSAELVIWTAVGGRFGLLGPVAGAVLIGFMASGLRNSFAYWEIAIALVFIVVVLRLPAGLGGLAAGLLGRFVPARSQLVRERPQLVERSPDAGNCDLRFDAVHVRMGTVEILNGLEFTVDQPGVHCIIGPNGAGKTSALNALTGRLPVAHGDIVWRGRSLANTRPYLAARHRIGRKFQVPSVFADLSVGQNLDIALWSGRLAWFDYLSPAPFGWRTGALDDLRDRFGFLADETRRAGELSVGERQMLDFSMTMLAEPHLVLLDEPCAGLSPAETGAMIEAIAAISADTGLVTIIVEHDMAVVERLADRVIVMHQGEVLTAGAMDEVRADQRVQAVYAGGTK